METVWSFVFNDDASFPTISRAVQMALELKEADDHHDVAHNKCSRYTPFFHPNTRDFDIFHRKMCGFLRLSSRQNIASPIEFFYLLTRLGHKAASLEVSVSPSKYNFRIENPIIFCLSAAKEIFGLGHGKCEDFSSKIRSKPHRKQPENGWQSTGGEVVLRTSSIFRRYAEVRKYEWRTPRGHLA